MSSLDRIAGGSLDWLVGTAWQVAALVLLVLVVQRLLGSRLTPRWRLGLWWIVVARLVLPPIGLPGVDVTGDLRVWSAAERASVPAEVEAAAPEPLAPLDREEERPATETGPAAVTATAAGRPAPVGRGISTASLLLLLWLAGAVGLAAIAIANEVRAAARLAGARSRESPGLRDFVDRCREDAGIRRRVDVHVVEGTGVPALTGLVRPRLLIPFSALGDLSPEDLRYVVHHELEHVRHHDIAVNWLLHAVLCLHWMNPFVWLALSRLRSDREMVRDLDVLARAPGASGRDYGRTMLRIVERSARRRTAIARVAILEPGRDVKRRIAMLARYEGRRPRGLLVGGLLTLIIALGATMVASEPQEGAPARPKGGAAPAAKDRPWVLVTGFKVTGGDLLAREKDLEGSLETLAEACLADSFQTISGAQLEKACESIGCRPDDLDRSADLRLAAAKALGGSRCISGWACSFGERVVLVVEVIDPARGLPGAVHRVSCQGLESIPGGLEELLRKAVLEGAAAPDVKRVPAPPAAKVEGLPDVLTRIPEDDLLETYPNDAYRRLVAMRERGTRFEDPRDRVVAERLLAETLEHARRLHEDRDYRDEWVVRTNVRSHPLLGRLDYDVIRRPPYLVFVQRSPDGKRLLEATKYGDALARFYAAFHEHFGKSLDLPRLEDRPRPHERILKVFVFTHRSDLTTVVTLPTGSVGYNMYSDQWLRLCVEQASHFYGAKPDPEEKLRRLVHEATHQLMHYMTKVLTEEERGEEVPWTDPALHSSSFWFQEGLAEFMAGAAGTSGDAWSLARRNAGRVKEWETVRDLGLAEWSLADLLAVRDPVTLQREAMEKHGMAGSPHLPSLFFAQASSFVHFLWNHEEGKYRDRFLSYMGQELHGRSGYRVWHDTWGKKAGDEDWSGLEAEWRATLK